MQTDLILAQPQRDWVLGDVHLLYELGYVIRDVTNLSG
jgi:hypothetical protein